MLSISGSRAIKLREYDSWVEVPSTGVQLPKNNKPIMSLEFDTSSLAIPVKIGAGAVLESGYRGGRQEAILRSLFTFVNSTNSALEVSHKIPRAGSHSLVLPDIRICVDLVERRGLSRENLLGCLRSEYS